MYKDKSLIALILFPLTPFISFLISCFNIRNRLNSFVFILFFALFGYCHTFEDVRADSYRKYLLFNNYSAKEYTDIYQEYVDGETKDIYEDILFNIVKSFSDNPHIMMMIVGIFGGFFYLLVVKRFVQDLKINYTLPIIILLMFIVIESNISLMGGIRNFSAFPLFMYSLIRLLIDNKKIWIVGVLLTPLVHFGYLIAVIAVLVIWMVKIPPSILHYLAIIACALSLFLETSSYSNMIGQVMLGVENEAIENRIDSYNDEYKEAHFNQSLTTKLTRVNNKIGACFIILLLIYIRGKKYVLRMTDYDNKLYTLLLFFTSFAYSLISFSVVGQRFVYITMVLLYMFLLNMYQKNRNTFITRFIYFMPFVFIIHIAWTLYNCYSVVGMDIFYQPLVFLLA